MDPSVQTPARLHFSSDDPRKKPEEDEFNRWPFAKRIAHVIRDRHGAGSLVVGLYGSWGEGKTTVLNFVEHALIPSPKVVVVRFNPWRYGDEEVLIRSFFDTIAERVGKKVEGDFRRIARGIGRAASVKSTVVPLGVDITLSMKDWFKKLDLDEAKRRFDRAIREAGYRVVVFLDDIDRLDKDEIHAVFRLVKLTADFERVTYMMAFDPDIVGAALQERYGPGRAAAGRDFIEKIVTVPLRLPPVRQQDLTDLATRAMNEALELAEAEFEDDGSFVQAFYSGLLPAIKTPRMARRYGNALVFALPILAGEVNPGDQMLIEGMRLLYPTLYRHVRRHPDVYLRSRVGFDLRKPEDRKAAWRSEVDSILANEVPQNLPAATALVDYLFPLARGGPDVDLRRLRRDKRAASDWHFERYFSYALPPEQISDLEFDEIVELAAEGEEVGAVARRLEAIVDQTSPMRLADGLYAIVETVPTESLTTLIAAVASLGDQFGDERDFLGLSSENRTTAALSEMVGRLPEPERQRVAERIVAESPSLTFALNFRGWADPAVTGKGDGVLRADGGKRLLEIIAGRIRDAAESAPLHLTAPDYASWFYGNWAAGRTRDEVAQHLADRLESHPDEALALVMSQLPRPMRVSGPRAEPETFVGDYSREAYDWLATYLDPSVVARAFEKTHQPELLDAGWIEMDYVTGQIGEGVNVTIEDAVVRQFMAVHRDVTENKGTDGSGAAD